ncbi:MAG: hypothetical protein WB420_17555 [Bradyrhizobium sp.]
MPPVPAEMAETGNQAIKRNRRFSLILQGFPEKKTGAARQD